jgi:hypothetical protein
MRRYLRGTEGLIDEVVPPQCGNPISQAAIAAPVQDETS